MNKPVVDDSQVLINVQTGRYPMSLEDVLHEVTFISLPKKPGVHQLSRLGYEVVDRKPKPTDGIYVEAAPTIEDDGRYVQRWRNPNEEELGEMLQLKKNEAMRHLKRQYQHLTNVGFAFRLSGELHHIPVTAHNRQYLLELKALLSEGVATEDEILIPTKKTTYVAVKNDQTLSVICDFLAYCHRLESAFLVLKKLTYDAKEIDLIPAIYDVTLEHEMARAQ